jgi:hypothetical protein
MEPTRHGRYHRNDTVSGDEGSYTGADNAAKAYVVVPIPWVVVVPKRRLQVR